jgi:hypothetical protein
VVPDGISYTITNVTQPANGKVTKTGENLYTYTPNQGADDSGKFYVTVKLTKDDGAFTINDVELVFELKASKSVLQRTIYSYDKAIYTEASAAYANGYAGYTNKEVVANTNTTQNSNTDIWLTSEEHTTYAKQNAIMEVSGKIYISKKGKYRFAIRGRQSVAFYYSLDNGVSYFGGGKLSATSGTEFHLDNPSTYVDLDLEAGQYVYFKEVMLAYHSNCYVGLGYGLFDDSGNVSVTYAQNAVRDEYEFTAFTYEHVYERSYDYEDAVPYTVQQTMLDACYTPLDSTVDIENLFDDDTTNGILSTRADISLDNPFSVTAQLNESVYANTFTIYGNPDKPYLPKAFVLYGGTDQNNLSVLSVQEAAPVVGNTVTVYFLEQNIRYYKLVVTDTYATNQAFRYVAYRYAEFSYTFKNAQQYSPSDERFTYWGKWEKTSCYSSFGHTYTTSDGIVRFNFTGTQFAMITDGTQNADITVKIDGKVAKNMVVSSNTYTNVGDIAFLSMPLSNREHSVTILIDSTLSIDSFALSSSTNITPQKGIAMWVWALIYIAIGIGIAALAAAIIVLVLYIKKKSGKSFSFGKKNKDTLADYGYTSDYSTGYSSSYSSDYQAGDSTKKKGKWLHRKKTNNHDEF